MTLLNAPVYDERKERLKKTLLIATAVAIVLLIVLTLAGFAMGHGWLFTNLPAEHDVSNFFSALEAKNYDKAYGIYNNDVDWKQHPDKYKDYPLNRFIEDWTTASPAGGPILTHHVDISKTDGSGNFGTGIIVAVRVTAAVQPGQHLESPLFMYYIKKTGELSYPAPHILQY
jgi:hypothetical protein